MGKRQNYGITLVALVITIIVMLILAGTTVGIGKISIDSYKDKILESEIGILQNAVMQQYTKYTVTKDEEILKGEEYTPNSADNTEEILKADSAYYKLNVEDLKNIGMEEPKDTYIVNYKTGEVFNFTSTKSDGTKLHLEGVK